MAKTILGPNQKKINSDSPHCLKHTLGHPLSLNKGFLKLAYGFGPKYGPLTPNKTTIIENLFSINICKNFAIAEIVNCTY
jgi:hypothetical protein